MDAIPPAAQIRFGPAGWSYDDWNGVVYPSPRPRGFHEAEFLSEFFDTIELNTTFYQPPRPEVVRGWARRVERNPNFKFTAKLWQRFTHDRDATQQDEKTFKRALEPLMETSRLGALLLQFPWSFKNNRENREYIGGLVIQFMEYPLVLEIRHASWNQPEVFEMLRDLGVGFCNIDQPVIGRSLAPSSEATAPVGYVRLHGRNYERWFTAEGRPEERYNYLYSLAELEPWATRVKSLTESTAAVYVITNNHFRGKGVANALQLITLVRGGKVPVPETLMREYPELCAIASEPSAAPPPESGFLFDAPATKPPHG
jgi:uncharacterized protein YecE (DUF72 family)